MRPKGMTPPRDFTSPGVVVGLEAIALPAFLAATKRVKGARGKGLRYEAKVTKWLNGQVGKEWKTYSQQCLKYLNNEGHIGYCIPDWYAVNETREEILLVEIKLTRVARAWWQLNELYVPMLRFLYPGYAIACVEIASRVELIVTPGEVSVIHSLGDAKPGRTSFLKVANA